MNSTWDWFSSNRKGYRKKKMTTFYCLYLGCLILYVYIQRFNIYVLDYMHIEYMFGIYCYDLV